ncbi:putative tricarboxylic transport membrane protein [Deinobacterium chartae]|uniref:Putative tricarboxylic transport membrane protein n=1 Tax=Deinobacterium chartae TaxID=521158 RepID=A0A841HYY0_9DEIO|nr:tripartite tricarboxylate transporter substrate binding protein [Deinobacterium chartae]MBB6097168.1 putative tricarboxylic transport membrane protein [Deinobacterium chartae]
MKHVLFTLLLATAGAASAQNIKLMAPATPGGGYDSLARNLAKILKSEKLVGDVEVYNVPGGGGTVGMAQFAKHRGDANHLMVMGMTTIGAIYTNKTSVTMKDVTPIARLTSDFETIVVPAASNYKTFADLLAAFKAKPESIIWGGASPGGAGHLFVGMIGQELGINLRSIKWVSSSSNLQAAKAMLAGDLTAVTGSYSVFQDDIKAGKLRALAISAPTRIEGINVPTAKEGGVNVEISNWRGVFAPAGISARERSQLTAIFTKLARSAAWRENLAAENQNSYFQPEPAFGFFLEREQPRILALLKELDLVK